MSTAKYHRINYSEVATFDATAPSAGSTWQHFPAIDPAEPDVNQEFDAANETSTDGMMSARYPTVRNGKASLKTRIYTGAAANGNGEAATSLFCQNLLESYFNHVTPAAGNGTTVASGGPGNSVAVTVASAGNINPGSMLIFAADGGAGTAAEMAVVTAKATNALTLDRDLSTAANYAASAEVYEGFDYKPTLAAYAKALYFNHELDGHSHLIGPGKIKGFKIEGLSSREGLRYVFEFDGKHWADGVTPSSFTASQTNYGGSPLVAVGSPIWVNGTQTNVADFSVDFGAKIEDIKATSATYGVAGMELVEAMPSGEFTQYYASARFTEYRAGTNIPLLLWVSTGSTDNAKARGSIGIYVPNAEIDVKEAAVNGQRGLKVTWRGKRPTVTQIANGLTAPIYFTVFGGKT